MNTEANIKIPPAVAAASARADELHKSIYASETTTIDPPAAEGEEQPAPIVMEDPPNEPLAPEPQLDDTTQNDQSWERKYKSMKGRHDRATTEISTLRNQLDNVLGELNVLREQMMTAPAPTPSDDFSFDVDDGAGVADESEYGQEFMSAVGRRVKKEIAPVINRYESQIKSLEAKLNGVGQQVVLSKREKMLQTLDERLPNWREVNKDPEFLDWLDLPDPYSGAIRQELLKAAYEQNHTPRVLNFFNGFLAQEAALSPARQEPPADPATSDRLPLESLAAPGRAKAAATPQVPAEKPIITRAQVARFYADLTAGKYRGRDQQKDQLEAMIFEAQREGRVR